MLSPHTHRPLPPRPDGTDPENDQRRVLERRMRSFLRGLALVLMIWSLLIGGSLAWNIHLLVRHAVDLARHEASTGISKDLSLRQWVTDHGGVYVPPDDKTPPNPYLAEIPDRDITTTTGKKLTLMNPAYVLRQAIERFNEVNGTRGHITSLNPVNPANAPDDWEIAQLQRFQHDLREQSSVEVIGKDRYVRVIRPMVIEAGCLKCHGQHGYKIGEVRGAISTSVPLETFLALTDDSKTVLVETHVLLWLCGVAAIGFVGNQYRRRIGVEVSEGSAVKALHQRHSLILESVGEGVFGLDRDGRCTFVNSAACAMFGWKAEELMGRVIHDIVHHKHPDGSPYPLQDCPLQQATRTGKVLDSHNELFYRRDGSSFPVAVLATPILRLGQPHGLVVVFRDITEEFQAKAELDKRTLELERSNQELEKFAYVASHDLREPLRMISTYLGLLSRRYGERLDQDAHDFLSFAREGAQRMDQLVIDLLEYSRVGRSYQAISVFPARLAVDQALDNLQGAIATSGAKITIDDLPMVSGIPSQMTSLFQNLIGNAIKYQAEGSVPEVTVTSCHDGRWTYIEVRDNGIGIDPTQYDRIFQIFQRLHLRNAYEGTGIGLAICKKIVEMHGGTITVRPNTPQGSMFVVRLPVPAPPKSVLGVG